MTEVERFQKKLKSVFTIMDESKSGNSGFYWEFLAPYFIELNKMDYDLVLANLVFSQQKDERVNIWVEENEEKIRNFYEWSSNYEW